MWAGVECTVNRVGNTFADQIERSGHAVRSKDLERIAALGVRTIRYPVLWERTAPQALDNLDWSWADERMDSLRRLGLHPIIGLVHHGSGPSYTSLLDPSFPEKLATYAEAVARRYPWVSSYTPVNEPLTTARFSCLYGFWYPHKRDALLFARALLIQCRATILAMRAIRKVNSTAHLVQTEDLGKTFSTQTLAYQAEFENERRWLTFDLLCGRIIPGSPMWDYFVWLGVQSGELEWFSEHQTSPDILGINHYITSERFIDQRLARYPRVFHGGNGCHSYADVEAVRVCSEGVSGPKAIMGEVWDRYRLPLAITEAHLGCTRDDQLRWLNEVWCAAIQSREEEVDIRAVTAWAAFGTYDWNSLLTVKRGYYEPGIFDVRSPMPRATAVAGLVETFASGKKYDHPTLDAPGWWHRWDRLSYPPVTHRGQEIPSSLRSVKKTGEASRPLLITGATGTLGQAFARICEKRGLAYHLLSRAQVDIADGASISRALVDYEPWALINAAGYVRVDDAEANAILCRRENVTGPSLLAKACAKEGVPLVTFSSDLVFDGEKGQPYVESDVTSPLNVYGASKADAEKLVLKEFPRALVIRTSAFFGPWDHYNFVNDVMDNLANNRLVCVAEDISISPTYVPDLAHATLDLLIDGEQGIWHLANHAIVTWHGFASLIADMAGYDSARVVARTSGSFGLTALRPSYTPLESERGSVMPSLEDSLSRFLDDRSGCRREYTASIGT
jgi:dTDP-4-dehydrorhamnose reductase